MSDFGTAVSRCKEMVLEPAEDTAIKEALVDALKALRYTRFGFSEKSDTFTTTAGTSEYQPGVTSDMPGDVLEIDILRIERENGRREDVRVASHREIRSLQDGVTQNGVPEKWSWFAERLHFDRPTLADLTVRIDYKLDILRDSATGDEITAESGNAVTNDFFTRGLLLLCARALWIYGLGRGKDDALTARMERLGVSEERRLVRHVANTRAGDGVQSPARF
jgi:hypothetical protein